MNLQRRDFGKDRLTMDYCQQMLFAGYKPTNLIEISYLECSAYETAQHGEGKVFLSTSSEYYLPAELEMAIAAFEARANSDNPMKHSEFARPHSLVLRLKEE